MNENIKDKIKQLELTMSMDKYPIIKSLDHLKNYNKFINDSLKRELEDLEENNPTLGSESTILNMEVLTYINQKQELSHFGNIMRVSLLTSLCAFIETVIITPCYKDNIRGDDSYEDFTKKYTGRKKKPGAILIAKEFIVSKGFSDINKIPNWEFISDMMRIRNCFVHGNGKTNKTVTPLSKLYDFKINDQKLLLGVEFTNNYIKVLEKFSVSFAEILYEDEGYMSKLSPETKFNLEKMAKAFNELYTIK